MTELRRSTSRLNSAARATAVMIYALTVQVPVSLSDPPPWAPAYGWRASHDRYYLGYSGKKWSTDFDVLDGFCNRKAVGAVLSAVGGSKIAPQVGEGEGRQVATIVGTVFGARLGGGIRDVDEKDRACLGHALELAGVERGVAWTNTDKGVAYRVIPLGGFLADNGWPCREFVTRATAGGRTDTVRHKACSAGNGVWQIVG